MVGNAILRIRALPEEEQAELQGEREKLDTLGVKLLRNGKLSEEDWNAFHRILARIKSVENELPDRMRKRRVLNAVNGKPASAAGDAVKAKGIRA